MARDKTREEKRVLVIWVKKKTLEEGMERTKELG